MEKKNQSCLTSQDIKNIEKDYISGMKIKDIMTKYNISKNTIRHHRIKALKEKKYDWLELRKYRLEIMKFHAEHQDQYLDKLNSIVETLLDQIMNDLPEIKNLSERLKIITAIEKLFSIKLKTTMNTLKGDKNSLLIGAKAFAEAMIIFLQNKYKETQEIDIEDFLENFPDIYSEIEEKLKKA